MTFFWAVFTWIVIWCVTLFVLLPSRRLSLKQKLWWNTALAALITLMLHLLLKSGLVPLRDVY